jgi:hypothetical protein
VTNVVKDLCHFLLLCPALEKIRRPLLNDISFNTVELDFVDLFEIGLLPFVSIECNIVTERTFTRDFISFFSFVEEK